MGVRPLVLVDNKDSFVWNLAQGFAMLGADVEVVRSDVVSVPDLVRRDPLGLVISPGPGRPEDAGISVAAVRELSGRVPILGVCLGHQAIGHAFGATVARSEPRHGLCSTIRHDASGVLAGIASPFEGCRYHSLHVTALREPLIATAHTDEGIVMALRHRTHPTHGVQFHPESFRSEHGQAILARFLELAR